MIFHNFTPISSLKGISKQLQEYFSSLWLDNIEECTAALSAIKNDKNLYENTCYSELHNLLQSKVNIISQDTLTHFRNTHINPPLGCLFSTEVLESWKQKRKEQNKFPSETTEKLQYLPSNIRLLEKFFPVQNQGHRKTCVAFAAIALYEYLTGCKTKLSEQFLYCACKNLDKIPDTPGTYLHTAMVAMNHYGVCPDHFWPYVPKDLYKNESQKPFPTGWKEAMISCRKVYPRSVTSNHVEHYKKILAGRDEIEAMPIIISVLAFNSWLRSIASWETGKISLPFPGEESVGAHAMCIAGYQDDCAVPGGGYFIVRNSWGMEWGLNSPEASGYALMPYEYVEKFALEAYSLQPENTKKTTESRPAHGRSSLTGSPSMKAIVYTDMVDSTNLVVEMGDSEAATFTEDHLQIVMNAISGLSGELAGSTDGALVLFDFPGEAILFALKYTDLMNDYLMKKGVSNRMRVGVHFGEVRKSSTDQLLGTTLAVIVAKRIMDLAQGGANTYVPDSV